jgi:sugar lactone lactonase YvrE
VDAVSTAAKLELEERANPKQSLGRRLFLLAGLLVLAASIQTARAAAGDLYVSEFGSGSVLKFDSAGNRTTFVSGLTGPFGLTFDRNGNLFVADKDTNSIFKITPSGTKTTFASGLHTPTALVFDGAGNLFVADFGGNAILKITPEGAKTTFASGLHNPSGLAFDRAGTLFQSDYGTGTLFKFTADGTKSVYLSGFAKPEEIVFDLAGNLFVSDFTAGTISKVTPQGTKTTFASALSGPWGLAFDPAGNLLEADSTGATVFAFAPNGTKTTRASAINTPTFLALEPPTGLPLNISTRMDVLTADKVMIAGFIIVGSDAKKVLVRGIGPSLSAFGITGTLNDPTLQLKQGDTVLATNDDWKENEQAINDTGIPPKDDRESAIVMTLPPGSYTAIESGKGDTTGIGLIEVYDLDRAANSSLGNISTRGFVETGNNVMIGGFIIVGGNGAGKVLIRGIGPSLTAFGIADALANPTLELRDVNGTLLSSNDDWQNGDADAVRATTIQPSNDLESAIVATLPAGNYTAVVSGKDGATGVGLVEVYNLR